MKKFCMIFCNMLVVVSCFAQPGSLDNTFGTGGITTTDLNTHIDWINSIAIQSDGKIVTAGFSEVGIYLDRDFAIARYNTDGTLDNTFGISGKMTTNFGSLNDVGQSVAIQSNGKIVVAGFMTDDFAVARYNTNAGLDVTFGSGGIVTTDFGASHDRANSLAIQSDGKIVVAGTSDESFNGVAMVRYQTNGSLDTTFGTGGKVFTSSTAGYSGNSVGLQPDGKIVVAGQRGGSNSDFVLLRYETNGALDTTFGTAGIVTTDVGPTDCGNSVVVQPDGKIVVTGYSYLGTKYYIILNRYMNDGTPDNTFGASGTVITDFSFNNDYGNAVALQPDGKIIVAGATVPSYGDFALARYTTAGDLDSTFGTAGKVITPVSSVGGGDYANSVALQADGKIVAAGYSSSGYPDDFAIVRYNGGNAIGIEDVIGEEPITIFPNPFFSQTTLRTGHPLKSAVVTVYNSLGQPVRKMASVSGHTVPLQRDNLPCGVYYIQVVQDNKIIAAGKLIITDK